MLNVQPTPDGNYACQRAALAAHARRCLSGPAFFNRSTQTPNRSEAIRACRSLAGSAALRRTRTMANRYSGVAIQRCRSTAVRDRVDAERFPSRATSPHAGIRSADSGASRHVPALSEPFEWRGCVNTRARRQRWEEDGYLWPNDSILIVSLSDDTFAGFVNWRSLSISGPQGVFEIGVMLLPDHGGQGRHHRSAAPCRLPVRNYDHSPPGGNHGD
jgi:hypothetical protein